MTSQNLLENLKQGISHIDELWQKNSSACSPDELKCQRGCNQCCLGLFEISFAEAVILCEALSHLPPADYKTVMSKAKQLVEKTRSLFPGDCETGLLNPRRDDESDEAFFDAAKGIPCPLLDLANGDCLLYEARPATCRICGLALKEQPAQLIMEACVLNFIDQPNERQIETAIDVADLEAADLRMDTMIYRAGFDPCQATTIAHCIVNKDNFLITQ